MHQLDIATILSSPADDNCILPHKTHTFKAHKSPFGKSLHHMTVQPTGKQHATIAKPTGSDHLTTSASLSITGNSNKD